MIMKEDLFLFVMEHIYIVTSLLTMNSRGNLIAFKKKATLLNRLLSVQVTATS